MKRNVFKSWVLSGATMAAACGGLFLSSSLMAEDGYKIVATAQTMGTGRIDYVCADSEGRRIYVPRGNAILVFDLDTLKQTGSVTNSGGHGVVIDSKSGHGFSSMNPVTMFDTSTLAVIKSIPVQGRPDGIFLEPATDKVYILSHEAPNVTVIDPKDGSITGTMDLPGAPEQAASDEKGRVFIDLEDQDKIAVVDPVSLKCVTNYSLAGKGGGPAGLALDAKNHVLFALCREPATCVILNADNGNILATLPIGKGTDGGAFNPNTMEAFSSQGDGTLTVIKESSPTTFEIAQTVTTKSRAKTCSLDLKKNRIVLITTEPAPGAASGGTEKGGGKRGGPGLLDLLVVGR